MQLQCALQIPSRELREALQIFPENEASYWQSNIFFFPQIENYFCFQKLEARDETAHYTVGFSCLAPCFLLQRWLV